MASERHAYHIRLPWRAAHARFAPWRTGRRPTKHALAVGLGVVVFAATARRAPPRAVGRGSSSPTPRHVGGCGFGTSWSLCSIPRARASPRREPADGPRSTCALADLAWLSSRQTRDTLILCCLTEALLHRHHARSTAAASYRRDHRVRLPWRAARARFAPWRTGRPPTEHTRAGGLGVVVFAANAQRAPPHAVGRGFSSSTPRRVAGGGFGTSCLPYSAPVVRSPCALRPVENRPTAHEACARCRTWRSCLRGHRATHSTPRCWPRLFFTDTASRRRLRLRHVTKPRSAPMLRDPRALRPVENQPADGPHSTCAGGLGVRGCLRGQRRDALHPTSLAEALLHRHRARSAAAASKHRG